MTVSVEGSNHRLNYFICISGTSFCELDIQNAAIRLNAEVKILNYWAVMLSQLDCYEATINLMANPDLWLKDDLGYPVYSDNRGNYYYDFRLEQARNLWIKG